jgi:hypothetical protein
MSRNDCKQISDYILKSRFEEKIQNLKINGKILETKNEQEISNNCNIDRPAKITINL